MHQGSHQPQLPVSWRLGQQVLSTGIKTDSILTENENIGIHIVLYLCPQPSELSKAALLCATALFTPSSLPERDGQLTSRPSRGCRLLGLSYTVSPLKPARGSHSQATQIPEGPEHALTNRRAETRQKPSKHRGINVRQMNARVYANAPEWNYLWQLSGEIYPDCKWCTYNQVHINVCLRVLISYTVAQSQSH